MLVNADWDRQKIVTRNITLSGGTYHQNGQNQEKHDKNLPGVFHDDEPVEIKAGTTVKL